jgi:DNA-binding response OmpR family regulator
MTNRMELSPKVLLVSNQQTTGPLLAFSLQEQQQLDVILESSPSNAVVRSVDENPDLVVLDINQPEEDIVDIIKRIRVETAVPILLLTSIRSEEFMVETYEVGVDECVLKPIGPSLFHAKVKGWLRRSWTVPADTLDPIKVGNIRLFPSDRTLFLESGESFRLTNLELRLIYFLMSRPNRTVASEELVERVWGYRSDGNNTALKNLVYRIRRKVELDPVKPQIIQTVVGIGYKFVHE